MTESSPLRVVLLARPGEARSRLETALGAAGTEVVLVADPLETEPAEVGGMQPQVILVSLEPAIEDTLERYEPLFADPSVSVLFDEADLAAQREGWDAARWARHLSAKLNRHDDVLPPGRESETDWPLPGPLPTRADTGELDITAITGEALALAAAVPRDDDFARVEATDDPQVQPPDGGGEADRAPEALAAATLEAPVKGGFGELSLVADESHQPAEATHASCDGAVLVEGGIGAPDAVRQLLAALPPGFPRPVLVRLQLDGGRYDRLVTQMARVSPLPVALAEAGASIDAGTVYFLDPTMGLEREGTQLRFQQMDDAATPVHARLRAAGTAILFLSGSEPALVAGALAEVEAGAMVMAQAPGDCYEPTAARVVSEHGGETASAPELAARLAQRWPAGHGAGGTP
jgi:chemosensory pili system protein ChpB (putative protein-glutamate methylesterase)